ncbi:MAG: toprim domain-containing protein, partial [Pseudomonadales bacterium]|nr:toprim domain-containing protein [Pseudomonadales bacterium]
MAKYLVIVESPTKAKTISKYLSTDFVVKSTVGPIRDLPMGGSTVDPREKARISAIALKLNPEERANFKKEIAREQLAKSMGFDPEQNWLASYTVLPG